MKAIVYDSDEKKLYKTAYVLAILTIIFSAFEGSFSVYFGYETNSLTLFGNGIASFIEVISGFGIAGMTMRIQKHPNAQTNDGERTALLITGAGLYILTVGLVVMGVINIFTQRHPDTTLSGIIIAIITIAAIGSLVLAKLRVGKN